MEREIYGIWKGDRPFVTLIDVYQVSEDDDAFAQESYGVENNPGTVPYPSQ